MGEKIAMTRRGWFVVGLAFLLVVVWLGLNWLATLWWLDQVALGDPGGVGRARLGFLGTSAASMIAVAILFAAVLRNNRERKRVEASLSGQMERWRITLESIGDGVIVTDELGRVAYLNTVAQQLCGWPQPEAVGKPLDTVFKIQDERTRAPAENPAARALAEGRVVCMPNHICLTARDGQIRPINDSAAPIRNAAGQIDGVVLVFRDDTEHREHERALVDANRRKDEFLAMLAHELRNPLAAMSAALDLIRFDPTGPPRDWSQEVFGRQVNHLTHLIDDLLDISRLTCDTMPLDLQAVEVAPIVRKALDSVRYLIDERKHRLEFEASDPTLLVFADPTRLEQIVVNLMTNAIEYTDLGGTIRLAITRKGTHACITVTDNGIGIAPELLPHMFDMFRQGKRSLARTEGGLGLGLTIVRKLTEALGGTVEAQSAGQGTGSQFEVRLPLIACDPAPQAGLCASDSNHAPGGLRVLIIDDNADLAVGLAGVLELQGHSVSVAHDGAAGFDAALAGKPDVVLLDIGLPTLDGYEVARRLRAACAGASPRIIAISGYGLDDDRKRSREAGMDHHLTKPLDFQVLTELLSAG